jgi:hypothetical protein
MERLKHVRKQSVAERPATGRPLAASPVPPART